MPGLSSELRQPVASKFKTPWLSPVLMLFLMLTLSSPSSAQAGGPDSYNISAILHTSLLGYDRRVRPNYGGKPTNVSVSLYILSMSDMSEKHMTYTIDLYFRQFWHDPRLSFHQYPGLDKLVLTSEFTKQIWVPDTFFVNERVANFHSATTENEFLRILQNGDVLRSIRLTITANCPLYLVHFPMDTQSCYLEIESFGYTMNDLFYSWHGTDKSLGAPDLALPQLSILGFRQRSVEAHLSSGNYSRLILDFVAERHLGYYLSQVYIPASLIVFMSWISFWVSSKATTARMVLCVTSVLTMTTLMGSVMSTLPKISYSTAIDKYLGVCFFMVFGSLIELAIVSFLQTKSDAYTEAAEEADGDKDTRGTEQSKQAGIEIFKLCNEKNPGSVHRLCDQLDTVCRFLFPGVFLFFHVVYWGYYLNASQENVDGLIPL